MKWVLLDFEGQIVRRFSYPAEGTVEIKEPELTFYELLEKVGECLL